MIIVETKILYLFLSSFSVFLFTRFALFSSKWFFIPSEELVGAGKINWLVFYSSFCSRLSVFVSLSFFCFSEMKFCRVEKVNKWMKRAKEQYNNVTKKEIHVYPFCTFWTDIVILITTTGEKGKSAAVKHWWRVGKCEEPVFSSSF